MIAIVLHIIMVNKPATSNDRQYSLTLGKKMFTRSFKWRLDKKKWDNCFPTHSGETLLLLPLLH